MRNNPLNYVKEKNEKIQTESWISNELQVKWSNFTEKTQDTTDDTLITLYAHLEMEKKDESSVSVISSV